MLLTSGRLRRTIIVYQAKGREDPFCVNYTGKNNKAQRKLGFWDLAVLGLTVVSMHQRFQSWILILLFLDLSGWIQYPSITATWFMILAKINGTGSGRAVPIVLAERFTVLKKHNHDRDPCSVGCEVSFYYQIDAVQCSLVVIVLIHHCTASFAWDLYYRKSSSELQALSCTILHFNLYCQR